MRYLFLIVALICGPLGAYAQSQEDEDKGFIVNLIEENLSGASRSVNIVGFAGALSSEATIEALTVADAQGVWLTLEDVTLIWSRSALLRGAIDIDEISAARIIVARAPVSEDTGPSPEAQPFSLPELPVSISLEQLDIAEIQLGESFLGEPISISLSGNAQLNGGEGSANVVAERLGDKSGIFEIDGSYANETKVLGMLLNLEEGAEGIAARILDLPGRPAIGLQIEGTAPIDNYEATIAIATDGQDRLTGSFGLASDDTEQLIRLDVGGDVRPLFDPAYRDFFGADARLFAEGRQTSDGRIDVSALDLTSERLNLKGALLIGAQGWPQLIDLTGGITADGEPVLLPISGDLTYVGGLRLDITYDGNQSDDWRADISIDDLERPGLSIDTLSLQGGGILRDGEGDQTGLVTAGLEYGAKGLQLDDAGAAQALGDEIGGVLTARRVEGEPTQISSFTLSGAGIEAAAQATIQGPGNGLRTDLTATFDVDGLERFASLIGQDLGGGAALNVLASVTPLDGLFDITLNGTTNDLRVGVEQADAVLAGQGRLLAAAVRDADGTRLEQLNIETDAALITANADLTSDGSDATFTARLNDLDLVAPGLNGPAAAQGTILQGSNDTISFDISGTGPAATLSVTGSANPAGTGQTVNATLKAAVTDLTEYAAITDHPLSGAANFTVGGVLLSDRLRFDIDVEAETTNVITGIDRLDPFLEGRGQLAASIARPQSDTFKLADLQLITPALRLTGDAVLDNFIPTTADIDLRVNDASLLEPSLDGPINATIDAAEQSPDDVRVAIIADGPGAAVQLEANVDLPTNEILGRLSAQLADLALYQTLTGRPLSGAVDMSVNGSLLADLSEFDLNLDARSTDLITAVARLDPFLDGRGQIVAGIARQAGDVFSLSDMQISTPALRLTGDAVLDAVGPTSADIDLRINDASLLDPDLNGPITATIDAERLASEEVQLAVMADGTGATFELDAQIDRAANAVTGDLSAQIIDLTKYQALVGQPLSGRVGLSANGTLLLDLSEFDINLDAQSTDLVTGVDRLDPFLDGRGQIMAGIARQPGNIFDLSNMQIITPALRLSGDAAVDAAGPTSADIDLRINNASLLDPGLNGAITATIDAELLTENDVQVAVLADGAGAALELNASIDRTTSEISGDVSAQLANLAAYRSFVGQSISGSVDLTANGSLLPDLSEFDASAIIQSQNVSIGNPTVDVLLRGTGRVNTAISLRDGDLSVNTLEVSTPQFSIVGALDAAAGAGEGWFNASMRDIGVLTDQISGPVRAQGTAELDNNGNWGVNANGTGPGGLTAQVAGQVSSSGQLNLDIDSTAPLALANAAIEPRRLSGTANINLSVNGPPQLSSVGGQITFSEGRLAAPTLGQALTDVSGQIGLNSGQAQVDLQTNVEAGGQVTIAGPVTLTAPYNADIAIGVRDVILQDPELYSSSIDGNVTINGPLQNGARIAGRLELGKTEVRVPSSSVSSLGELPTVLHLGQSAAVQQTLVRAGEAGNDDDESGASSGGTSAIYPLDIEITAPGRIFIRGRGLDAELGGQLNIRGTSGNIVPNGRFELVRGRIDILQQRFDLTEGVATLQGDFEPFIRLVATTESENGTTINIIVEGPAGEPEVTFESSPELPQDEVLSQLIFGRDLDSISPLQAVQLASAISTLAGKGGGALGRLRENIGVDDLDVSTGEEGETEVRAGKRISDNIYTDVTVSSGGGTEVNLNLDITKGITARGGVNQEGDTSIGVFFERDY